jgi:hypothetical protein
LRRIFDSPKNLKELEMHENILIFSEINIIGSKNILEYYEEENLSEHFLKRDIIRFF